MAHFWYAFAVYAVQVQVVGRQNSSLNPAINMQETEQSDVNLNSEEGS